MEPTENLHGNKSLILDTKRYGYWKVRMTQIIRGQGEDAWTAVEEGWEAPTKMNNDGEKIPKPKAEWTVEEKNLSKFNAKAMNAIFSGVEEDEFKLIQGCKSAKQAWDILQNSHEGTSKVKQTRLDHLTSRFEGLKMNPEDSITQFSSKISAIANEAEVLGKTYKDQKLVKKLIRCLPPKFAAHKAVMRVSGNLETLKFDELVGMLKSEEMENEEDKPVAKGIAFQTTEEKEEIKEIKDNVALLTKNFSNMFNKVGREFSKETSQWNNQNRRGGSGRNFNNAKKQEFTCHECGGAGHMRYDCPTLKMRERKCSECNGIGHSETECISKNKSRHKSFLGKNESESEEEEEDEMINMVAFITNKDTTENPDSDDEDKEVDSEEEYQDLYNAWKQMNGENLHLIHMKEKLTAQVDRLTEKLTQKRCDSEQVKKKIAEARQNLAAEREKTAELQEKFNRMNEKMDSLSQGTEKLDHILSMGRLNNCRSGLGYNHSVPSTKENNQTINFVKEGGKFQAQPPLQNNKLQTRGRYEASGGASRRTPHQHTGKKSKPSFVQHKNICGFCNKTGHHRQICDKFKRKIQTLWKQNRYHPEPNKVGCVWISKRDLYSKSTSLPRTSELNSGSYTHGLRAYSAQVSRISNKWYFDSGCSNHMTGREWILKDIQQTETGSIRFGGGEKGRIKGIGKLNNLNQPILEKVLLVEGLQTNLMSISQLCDNNHQVLFTKDECKVLNEQNQTVLMGTRSTNNCYVWKPVN